jgi:hypothetical protein
MAKSMGMGQGKGKGMCTSGQSGVDRTCKGGESKSIPRGSKQKVGKRSNTE